MDTNPARHENAAPETDDERQARRAAEIVQVQEALASVQAGRFITEGQFDAWIDSLGADDELPPPTPLL